MSLRVRLLGPSRIRVSLGGTQGPPGSWWYQGTGTPDPSLGRDGDFYLDVGTGDIYQRSAGAWVLVANMSGPPGDVGPPGTSIHAGDGAPSDDGALDGDLYIDALTGDLYEWQSPWTLIGNIRGPEGPAGPPGPPGTGGGSGSGSLSTTNQGMVALTAGPFELACATPIAIDPSGYVQPSVNGILYRLGDGVRTAAFYFSADSGATARAIADIVTGDLLFVGSDLGFTLDSDDRISFLFC